MDELPSLYRRSALVADGFAPAELRRMLRDGSLRAVRPGSYIHGGLPTEAEARHLLAVHAARKELSADSVVSYASAALMYGLSVWNVPLNRVHVTRNRRRSGGRKDPRVHLHAAPLGSADVVEIDGLLVTSVALTLLDIARTVPMEQAVVVADQALARHLVTAEELGDAIAERRRWPGMPAARAAHWSSPPRAAGASASRAAGWPLPAPGCRCRSCSGRSPTRQAGSWAKWTSAGPLCARSASSTAVSSTAPSRTRPRRFIRRSCARTLRGEDLGVVRWGWDALTDYRDTAARLRRQYRPI